jgi:hypothetical protein
MVGSGGGAPYYGTQEYDNIEFSEQEEEVSEDDLEDIRDIRLGDVVVSLHSKAAEAVVQYDFGKSLQEEFVHTGGKLNKPPAIVLSAVSVLQQQHKRKGHMTSELLADTLSKNPGMAEEFRYPGLAKDRLFKPDIVHLEGRKSCKACCGPNNVNLVRRTDRHGTAPKIHYGTIGSADQVMRDAILRDKALDKIYNQTMERIEDQIRETRELAKQILFWIFYARRPLSTEEIRHALAVKIRSAKLDKDYLPSANLVRSLCLGLVTIDGESGMIRLVHYTTQEYFRRTQSRWFPDAELEIVKTCITYLSFHTFQTGFCEDDAEFETRLQSNVLYDYAARNWGHHAGEASIRARQSNSSLLNGAAKVSGLRQDMPTQMASVDLEAYSVYTEIVLEFLNSES